MKTITITLQPINSAMNVEDTLKEIMINTSVSSISIGSTAMYYNIDDVLVKDFFISFNHTSSNNEWKYYMQAELNSYKIPIIDIRVSNTHTDVYKNKKKYKQMELNI